MSTKNNMGAIGEASNRDLVNQLLGQAQAFQAAGNLLQTFGVSKLAIVKESKLYQQLNGMKTPNGLELKGTWVEFCELLGISDEKANQDIANLHVFGEAALEQMQRVGIGYRELRSLRRLPDDERAAALELASQGDKSQVIEFIEAVFDKHSREKFEMQKQAEGKARELEAEGKKATKLQTALNDAETLLAAASKKRQLSDLKPATNIIREEALSNVGTVQYGFAGLQKLWDEVEAEDADAPERLLRREQLWFAMHGAVSFGLKTLAHIAALAPDGMPTQISAAHVLTPEEADHWEQEWLTIQAGFKHKEAQRHDARVAELPRGRGRPAGSKNKDGSIGAGE